LRGFFFLNFEKKHMIKTVVFIIALDSLESKKNAVILSSITAFFKIYLLKTLWQQGIKKTAKN